MKKSNNEKKIVAVENVTCAVEAFFSKLHKLSFQLPLFSLL